MLRVRFAPSPTGHLHIGGVRTALFNFLFARHHGGTFILRIEDTDRSRSTEESIAQILDGLTWLQLKWDEGPYRQTERLELYREHVARLVAAGKAYRCYCTAEELEARRKGAQAAGAIPKYDRRCRDLSSPQRAAREREGRKPAIRFAAPIAGETAVDDLLHGRVVFPNENLDDLIILRSDETPTYNLCVVVDDVTMRITHVIRGDDHLNNTPRQLLLYEAFSYPPPKFAHLPMILGADKARLSKRHGATSITEYRDQGYLPEALNNYLARLGWSHGDQEIFSMEEMIEKFDLADVGKSAAVFNPEKLLWLNGQYIHRAGPARLAELVRPFLPPGAPISDDWLSRIVVPLRERSRTLVELAGSMGYFLSPDYPIDPKAEEKFLTAQTRPRLARLADRLARIERWEISEIEKAFSELLAVEGLKLSDLAQPVRVALTGRTVSPGIYEVVELLGKEETLRRLSRFTR